MPQPTYDPTTNQWYTSGPIADVTGTADATYSANEVTLVNDLKAALNAALAALRAAGVVKPS
jgi:hypothetical protein